MKKIILMFALILSVGCAGSSQNLCEEATQHVSQCGGDITENITCLPESPRLDCINEKFIQATCQEIQDRTVNIESCLSL